MLEALRFVVEPENYPLLIICTYGKHRSGTVVACLRKLQRWNLTAIFEEYRRYGGNKIRLQNEQFIELFDTDLIETSTTAPNFF